MSRHKTVGRDTKKTKPCRDTKLPDLCHDTKKCVATPKWLSLQPPCRDTNSGSRHQKVCNDIVPAWPRSRAPGTRVIGVCCYARSRPIVHTCTLALLTPSCACRNTTCYVATWCWKWVVAHPNFSPALIFYFPFCSTHCKTN